MVILDYVTLDQLKVLKIASLFRQRGGMFQDHEQ